MPTKTIKLRHDPRFALHQRQPRADKLDARQRMICRIDTAFHDALELRVSDPGRFSAFMAGSPYYFTLERACGRCGSGRKRTRDRSCYKCHLNRSGENFELMKAGISPNKKRSLDGHRDFLARKKLERAGEHEVCKFGELTAKRWATGRLEISFPNGAHEPDLSKLEPHLMRHAMDNVPELMAALVWAGWF